MLRPRYSPQIFVIQTTTKNHRTYSKFSKDEHTQTMLDSLCFLTVSHFFSLFPSDIVIVSNYSILLTDIGVLFDHNRSKYDMQIREIFNSVQETSSD